MERIHSGPMAGRDRERTDDAAREIRAAGSGQVDVFVADVSSQSEVRRLADEVLHSLPRIDVLINNVGGYWNTRHVTEQLSRPVDQDLLGCGVDGLAVGSFDELAGFEAGSGADEGDEVGWVHGAPPGRPRCA